MARKSGDALNVNASAQGTSSFVELVNSSIEHLLQVFESLYPSPLRFADVNIPVKEDKITVSFRSPVAFETFFFSDDNFVEVDINPSFEEVWGVKLLVLGEKLWKAYFFNRNGYTVLSTNTIWPLVYLMTPQFCDALRNAKVYSKSRVGAKWFREFLEAVETVAESESFKIVDPSELLNPYEKITRMSVEIYELGNWDNIVDIFISRDSHRYSEVDISVYLNEYIGSLEYYSAESEVFNISFKLEEGVDEELFKKHVLKSISTKPHKKVAETIKTHLEAYKLVLIALAYMDAI